jgi:hypothetical protein
MKYIITESRLENVVLKYLNYKFTPLGGWNPKEYIEELKDSGGESFIFFEDENDDTFHIWYSTCDNPNVELDGEDCPIVAIPDKEYYTINSLFGEDWKPIFIKWFKKNTKLRVKSVSYLDE